MQEFLEVIQRMEKSDDRNFFEYLYTFFMKINSLGREETIAIYQALRVFESQVLSLKEREKHKEFLHTIDRAIIDRMRIIIAETPTESRCAVAEVFWSVSNCHPFLRKSVRLAQGKSDDGN